MNSLILLAILLVTASSAFGTDIHRWKDENGNIVFGDKPPAAVDSALVLVKPNVYKSPNIERLEAELKPSSGVVLYSAVWCGYCKKARNYFTANAIPFKEYDVEKSAKGKRDYTKLKAKGVPVILVGKKRLNGFSESSFNSVYKDHAPST